VIERYSRAGMKQIWSDENKYDKWLKVEIAVCEAWAEDGVIPPEDMAKLRQAKYDPVKLEEIFQITRHDMTAFVQSITSGLEAEGRWIHLGLTSNDVIDISLCLQIREAADMLLSDLDILIANLKTQAIRHKQTLIMGRTHGVHAEPTTFGLKLALWWDEMLRHRNRLEQARNTINVGKISGAVGTHATIPPHIEERVCASFGVEIEQMANQIVQRDRHAHFVTTIALIASSLEKFATEIRGLQRTEVREVEEPFGEGQTGSSAMPHKKNPELSERVCGLARLIRGYALTSMENVALWHERDISHSSAERIILPDSTLALDYILDIFSGVIEGLRVYPDRMMANIEMSKGLVFSQRVLLALIEKGLSREKSYAIVQAWALECWQGDSDFRDLLRGDPEVTNVLSTPELESIFDYNYYTRYVDYKFQRAGLEKV